MIRVFVHVRPPMGAKPDDTEFEWQPAEMGFQRAFAVLPEIGQ